MCKLPDIQKMEKQSTIKWLLFDTQSLSYTTDHFWLFSVYLYAQLNYEIKHMHTNKIWLMAIVFHESFSKTSSE